ncbi:hypothetical protein Tco_0616055 [Tanacetum coccineum]
MWFLMFMAEVLDLYVYEKRWGSALVIGFESSNRLLRYKLEGCLERALTGLVNTFVSFQPSWHGEYLTGFKSSNRLLRHKLEGCRNGLNWLGEYFCVIPALMVVESKVLNDFPRFFSILIAEVVAGGAVNLVLKMKRDMIIKIGFEANDRCHDEGLFVSFSVERIEQGNE